MNLTQLTPHELRFVTDMVTVYRARRVLAIAKSVRKSPSADLEALSLNTLVYKLEVLHTLSVLQAKEEEELPDIAPLLESLG